MRQCPKCGQAIEAEARSLLDELRDEGLHLHVVDGLIAKLWGALRFDGRDSPPALLRAIRDQLAEVPDGALAEAANVLLRERSVWPSAAIAFKAAQAVQAKHMLRITPGTTAWSAWVAHWHSQGHKFLARTYEAQGYALVPRQFPIVDAKRETTP